MDALSRIFGSPARLRLLRLFIFNATETFAKEEIVRRLKVPAASFSREIAVLEKSGLVKRRMMSVERTLANGRVTRKRVPGYAVHQQFPFFSLLQKFLIDTTLIATDDIIAKLRRAGRIDMLAISGIFTRQWEARLDLLVVGSKLDPDELERGVKAMEAELGRELKYAVLQTEEFYYRRSIQDKLIRDVLDFPHQILVDRVGMR